MIYCKYSGVGLQIGFSEIGLVGSQQEGVELEYSLSTSSQLTDEAMENAV